MLVDLRKEVVPNVTLSCSERRELLGSCKRATFGFVNVSIDVENIPDNTLILASRRDKLYVCICSDSRIINIANPAQLVDVLCVPTINVCMTASAKRYIHCKCYHLHSYLDRLNKYHVKNIKSIDIKGF